MTQEEKQLLLQDLCARLPYKVKVEVCVKDKNIKSIDCVKYDTVGTYIRLMDDENFSIKPYLRQISSMTEDEKIEWFESVVQTMDCDKQLDFYCKHNFDYRGLIEKGLALEAPKGMYNTKTE
jgi:hypothetical protein